MGLVVRSSFTDGNLRYLYSRSIKNLDLYYLYVRYSQMFMVIVPLSITYPFYSPTNILKY